MAKAAESRRKIPSASVAREAHIRAAIRKAIRDVGRNAEVNKITLAMAGKKSWPVHK